jgi:hypothetical protein
LNALQKNKAKFINTDFFHEALIKDFLARSAGQFIAMGVLMLADWHERGENLLAEWFRTEYLTPPYNTWHVSASGIPGADPQQQPIESYHRNDKRNCFGAGRKC